MTLPTEPLETGEAIELAASKPTTSVVLVNAATAARWLERNKRNRRISSVAVERYRRDIAEGRWVFAADPVRFSDMGNLLDGQHRLTALSMVPEASIPLLVVRGLPDDTQFYMDQGRKRSAGQQLELKGIRNSSNVASAVKVYIVWRDGLMFRDNKMSQTITSAQIEAWVDEHADHCAFLSSHINPIRRADAPPSAAGAAALRFYEIDPSMAGDFFQHLADGGMPKNHPINTLDKRLQRNRREGLKMSTRDYLSLYILAWNAWRDGRQMSKFQRPRGGSWTAESFPEPK